MMTLEDWLQMWLEMYVYPGRLADSTKRMHGAAAAAVPDQLRRIALAELHPLMLHAWLLQVSKVHPRAAQIYHGTLSQALRLAAKLELCKPGLMDPDVVPMPVHQARTTQIYDSEQLHQYIRLAAGSEAAPALLMCCCGLRRGEALGMSWDCVDLQQHVMDVRGQRRNGKYLPLKTAASARRILMPEILCTVLESWPRTSWYCYPGSEATLYRVHSRVAGLIEGPEVTLHGLRHSIATLAAASGQPIKLLQGALGHANYKITADLYAHHLPDVATVISAVI